MIAPRERQLPVNEYFEQDVAFWQEIYEKDDVLGVIYRERAARAVNEVDRLRVKNGSKVLEVGCGAGLVAIDLAQRGFLVEATDSTPAMIARTRRNAERAGHSARLNASLADVHELQYPDGVFALVMGLGVLPWLHSPATALKEMSRVLQPGGHLLVTADNRGRLTHLLDPLFNPFLQPIRHGLGHGRPEAAYAKTMWRRKVDRDLATAGFRKQRSFTVGFAPFTILGREVAKGATALAINIRLQKLADQNLPFLHSMGCHYVVVAQKQ